MYKDPVTNENIYTHPAELKRIQGYRDHGFDELNPIHEWIMARLEENNWGSFYETRTDEKGDNKGKNYLFVNCEKKLDEALPHFKVEIDTGYIDFQDEELTSVASIKFVLHKASKLITLDSAKSHGKATEDVVRVLSDIIDGPYLKLEKKSQ